MRLAMRVLFVLAVPGVVFGFLTQVSPLELEFDSFGDLFTVHEPWLDVLGGLAVAAAIIVAAAITVRVLFWLGFDGDPRRRRTR
jgi:cytochrome c biogenesis protein CcdA